MFELEYIKYIEIISGKTSDINLIINSSKFYENLKVEAFKIYNEISDKKTWIQAEIKSLINENITIPLNFDIKFKKIYCQSLLRFDLINEYLKFNNLTFDITAELNKVFENFLNKKKIYKILHVLFIMTTNSINSTQTYNFIEKLLDYYFIDEEYEDKTLIYEIEAFLDANYPSIKVNYIRKKYDLYE